ncbi:MAG: hypothetical protein IPK53_19240 [bacterium]|nr:hypothetical protein [bacterium]
MTRGFIKLPRAFFVCPLWTEPTRRTPAEAYFDLLQRAAFHTCTMPLGTGTIQLFPGQLFVSCRKLAEEWKWQGREVRDFLLHLRELRIADLEDLESGYRISLHDPVPDPSKNSFSLSSLDSKILETPKEEEMKSPEPSKKTVVPDFREPEWMAEVHQLHADYPGILESVEFIEFKERKRLRERRPPFSPARLREAVEEFLAEKAGPEQVQSCQTATPENSPKTAECLQESVEKT